MQGLAEEGLGERPLGPPVGERQASVREVLAQDEDRVVEREDAGRAAEEVLSHAELPSRLVGEVSQRDQEPGQDEEDADADVPLADHHLQDTASRLEVIDEDEESREEPERSQGSELVSFAFYNRHLSL